MAAGQKRLVLQVRSLAVISIVTAFILAALTACRRSDPPVPPTDLHSDSFHSFGARSSPGSFSIVTSQEPGRWVETPLRPLVKHARLPSPYLNGIARIWAPYAREVWDYGVGGFALRDAGPVSAETIDELQKRYSTFSYASLDDVVLFRIGGYGSLHPWHPRVQIPEPMTFGREGKVRLRFFGNEAQPDGSAIQVDCVKANCVATFLLASKGSKLSPGVGFPAVPMEVRFARSTVPRWSEIRRKSLCFAEAMLPELQFQANPSASSLRCADVDHAINRSLAAPRK